MNKLILFGLIFFLILVIPIHADLTVRYNKTTNTLGNAIWNETWTSAGNKTFYVNIPKNATVVDAKLNLSGYWTETALAEDDTDDAYSSEGCFNSTSRPASLGVDEDWVTWGGWDIDNPSDCNSELTNITTNWTLPNVPINYIINVTIRTKDGGVSLSLAYGVYRIYAWNYTNSVWTQILEVTTSGATIVSENRYVNISSSDFITSGQPIRIKRNLRISFQVCGSCRLTFYEDSVTFYIKNYTNSPYLDVSGDGDKQWSYSGEFNQTDNQTSDFSSEINNYLKTCYPYVDGTCDVPFILHSDSAGIIQITLNATLTYDTETYETPVNEGQNTTFWIKVNSTTDITDVNASLVWNGTNYSYTTKSNTSTYWIFTRALTVPTVSASGNMSFYWNFTYTNATSTYAQNFSSKNQYVYAFTVTNCTGGNITLNFTAYDEENSSSQLNFLMDLSMDYWISSASKKSFTYSYTDNNTYYLCLSPSDSSIYANVIIKYWNSSYGTRYYYLTNALLTNATQNISLYLLNESIGQAVLFSTYNNQEYPISDANIAIYRQMGTDWNMIANGITDDTGSYTFILEPTINYNIIITASGYQTKNIYLIPVLTTYKIYLSTGESNIPSYWDYWNSITASCNYVNETRLLTCTWTDVSSHLTAVHLQVTKTNNTVSSLYCDNTSSMVNGTFVCNFGSPINNTFMWSFWGEFSSIASRMPFASGSWTDNLLITFGMTGLLMAFLIILTSGMFGIALNNPVFTIIMILMGIGASFLLGMIDFTGSMLSILIGFFIAGGILIFKLR